MDRLECGLFLMLATQSFKFRLQGGTRAQSAGKYENGRLLAYPLHLERCKGQARARQQEGKRPRLERTSSSIDSAYRMEARTSSVLLHLQLTMV